MMATRPRTKLRVVARSGPSESRDELAAFALATGATREQAAKDAGMSTRTLYHRLNDSAFVALVQRHRNRILNESVGQLVKASGDAVSVLRGLMGGSDPQTQLRAAVAVLDHVVQLSKHAEFAERLAAMEKRIDEQSRSQA
jgi:hypothetical protein